MAELKLHETQAISELASLLYGYLPGTAHPFSPSTFTFGDAAQKHGLSQFWAGGSKFPALTGLLADTWRFEPARFERLLITIVQEGIKYRAKRGRLVTRAEIEAINVQLTLLGLWIPELGDARFLHSLPDAGREETQSRGRPGTRAAEEPQLAELRERFAALATLPNAQERGYALEPLLNDLFALNGLAPRAAFRIVGEQIDGSFEFQGDTYLVEARWREKPTNASDLYAFQEKVERKSPFTRGLFVSVNGFTEDALQAFSTGKAPRIIGMDGRDLAVILEGLHPLKEALHQKARALHELGAFYKPLD